MYRSCNIRGPDARLSSILRLTLESRKYKGNDILLQLYMKISKCVIEIKDMILYHRIILIIIYIYISYLCR